MIKIFGAAFDPLDIADRIDIKAAYIDWLRIHGASENDFLDPYDYVKFNMKERYFAIDKIGWIGKFPIPSWLSPKPSLSDINHISQNRYTEFLDSNGCHDYCDKLEDYLYKNIGLSVPFMIGVDHCFTGGALRYLKSQHNNYNVLIFDSHCDLVDLEMRKHFYGSFIKDSKEAYGEKDIYECGSFLDHILKEKIIKPENLWIIGTQDLDTVKQNAESLYCQKILPWIQKGVHLISKNDLILFGIPKEIEGKTYISFDMDLGSLASVLAARFLDYFGLNMRQFLAVVHELSERIRTKRIELIGLDIMEIDIHFLGAEIHGNQDHTVEIAGEIIDRMIYRNFRN